MPAPRASSESEMSEWPDVALDDQPSALADFSTRAAQIVVAPDFQEPADSGDITDLIALIASIVLEILENCPADEQAAAAAARRPSIMQKARFYQAVRHACKSCPNRWRERWYPIALAMQQEAAASDDVTLKAIVAEARA